MNPSHLKVSSKSIASSAPKRPRPVKRIPAKPRAAEGEADVLGLIRRVNAEFTRMWGYESSREVVGRPLISFFKDKHKAPGILAALERHGTWEGEFQALRKDGSVFWAKTQAEVVRDEEGMRVALRAKFYEAQLEVSS